MNQQLTIRDVTARPVQIPLTRPHESAGGSVGSAPLVLIDLLTEEGIAGASYLFCFAPFALAPTARLLTNMGALVVGATLAPQEIARRLRASFRFIGPQGLVGLVMAGIDMAAWDALAKAAELPLARLLGGTVHATPAYASLGKSDQLVRDAEELAAAGFRAIKVKLGSPDARDDLEHVRAMRRVLGDEIALMVDYNQALSVPEAILRGRMLDEEGVTWIEEPTAADDSAGHARIAREVRTPIQLGENWWGTREMARSVVAEASDFVMVDPMKIGGVSGWVRAAALAEAYGLPLSSHIAPEICAHLLAATPTAHWLEYHDWLNPILQEPLTVEKGMAMPSATPGAGISWDEAAIRKCLYS